MRKIIIFAVFVIAIAGVIGVSAFSKNTEDVVGYVDGQPVKVVDLQTYVDTLLGDSYKKKLDSKEGRKELFGHYVNRMLLLDYAKKNIEKEDSFVASHTMGKVDIDSAMLSAVLKKEINDKVRYTEEEVSGLLQQDIRLSSMEQAEREIISQKRIKLFNEFMDKVKTGHDIELTES